MKRRSARVTVRLLGPAACVLFLAGCFGSTDTNGGAPGPTLPTPQASLSAQVQGTAGLVGQALAAAGFTLGPPVAPYRPSEPDDLSQTPRANFQVSLGDPNSGFVVIYEFPDAGTATARGRELAAYLGSGFGQTNYPLDAQFSIGQVGSTLVFTWWSGDRAPDRQRAQAAFDAVASVGQPIPVLK